MNYMIGFARYAKYDDYYTCVSPTANDIAFARYAKYDDYYTYFNN